MCRPGERRAEPHTSRASFSSIFIGKMMMERRAKRRSSQLFSGKREQKRQFLFSGTVVRSWGRNTRSFLQDSISKTLGAAGYNDCSEIPHHRPQLRAPLFSWKLCLGPTPPHSKPSPSESQASGSSSPGAVQDQAYRVFKLPWGEQSLEFSGFPVSWLGAGNVLLNTRGLLF